VSTTIINPALVFADQAPAAGPAAPAAGKAAALKSFFARMWGTGKHGVLQATAKLRALGSSFWAWLTSHIPAPFIVGGAYLALSTKRGFRFAERIVSGALSIAARSVGWLARLAHKAIDKLGDAVTWVVSKFSAKAGASVGNGFAKFGEKRLEAGSWIRNHVEGYWMIFRMYLTSDAVVAAVTTVAAVIGVVTLLAAVASTFGVGAGLVAAMVAAPVVGGIFSFIIAGGWAVAGALALSALAATIVAFAWDVYAIRKETKAELQAAAAEGETVDNGTVNEAAVAKFVEKVLPEVPETEQADPDKVIEGELVPVGAPSPEDIDAAAKAEADAEMAKVKAVHGSNPQKKRHPRKK
jgi:hypothetical protein